MILMEIAGTGIRIETGSHVTWFIKAEKCTETYILCKDYLQEQKVNVCIDAG